MSSSPLLKPSFVIDHRAHDVQEMRLDMQGQLLLPDAELVRRCEEGVAKFKYQRDMREATRARVNKTGERSG